MIAETRCPYCGQVNEVITGIDPEARPSPGDKSLCWSCRGIAVFTPNGGVRAATPDELRDARQHPDLRAIMAAAGFTPSALAAVAAARRARRR